MAEYILKNIDDELVVERFAEIKNQEETLFVHYLEYEELSDDKPRKIGDTVKGTLSIDSILSSSKTEKEFMHEQNVYMNPEIVAIVEVLEVLDVDTFLVKTDISSENMIAHFEQPISYKPNDRIYIEGSLELEIE